jgi:hypothetical protein
LSGAASIDSAPVPVRLLKHNLSLFHGVSLSGREWTLILISGLAVIATLFVPPIPQDPAYHVFVDTRTLLGIPNFWNVFSNVGYLAVGVYGLAQWRHFQFVELRVAYITFCIGVTLVAFGSSYYHFAPSTPALVWDRLPMSIAFMALLTLTLGERVSVTLAGRLLWPLVAIGVASVFYWDWTEQHGAGDLRPYGVVQFLPILLMPLLLLLFPVSAGSAKWLWYTFAGYVVAKIAEQLDETIYAALGLSGHSIKHFISSVAVLFAVFAMLEMRAPARNR